MQKLLLLAGLFASMALSGCCCKKACDRQDQGGTRKECRDKKCRPDASCKNGTCQHNHMEK